MFNPLRPILENPVIAKELRGRMRGRRAFVLITIYIGIISLLLGIIYLSMMEGGSSSRWDPQFQQTLGKVIFGTVVIVELLLTGLIGPSLTAGAIASERERQTLEVLRTTLLSPSALVLGKLGSAILFLMLLIVAALPIQSLAFFLGGVGFPEMLISWLLLFVNTLTFCSVGIFFSSLHKTTAAATSWSYGTILAGLILPGVITFLITISFFNGSPNDLTGIIFSVIAWLILSTNPVGAAVASEVVLVENQSLFYMDTTMAGMTLYFPSPWIIFTLSYTGFTVILLLFSIGIVRRPEK